MVQRKNQKQKQKKQLHVKKHGKQAVLSEFRSQVDALGLKITEVTADGNCFFRALADQLEGNEGDHEKYRSLVVKHILDNREMFEPFIENDETFDEYCQSMEKNGTWAGHMELQAASLVTHCNICIHQNRLPRWYVHNFKDHGARMIHLSYHDGEHYNSIRLKDDPCKGPARAIIIKADTDVSSGMDQEKFVPEKARTGSATAGSVKMIMAASRCKNTQKVEEVLLQVGGDVDVAVEFLICEQEKEGEYSICDTDVPSQSVDIQNGDSESGKLLGNCNLQQCSPCNATKKIQSSNGFRKDKNIPRNKVCPRGSGKKHKTCCGSGNGKSTRSAVNSKSKEDKKRAKKGNPVETERCEPDASPPDMGALCI